MYLLAAIEPKPDGIISVTAIDKSRKQLNCLKYRKMKNGHSWILMPMTHIGWLFDLKPVDTYAVINSNIIVDADILGSL